MISKNSGLQLERRSSLVSTARKLFQHSTLRFDVLFRETQTVIAPSLVIFKGFQSGLLNFAIQLIRLRQLNLEVELVLPRAKRNEVVWLAVFGKTDVELVVLEFQARVQVLQNH
jgi:hypothetical protein